jgi:large subunit ribosomal protein L28
MARICAVTGKRPVKGNIINRKGQSKKSGGIGTHITSITKRKFRPNLQRIKIKLPGGGAKRVWVAVKAIKAGLVEKSL